jgi:hypothetical protein
VARAAPAAYPGGMTPTPMPVRVRRLQVYEVLNATRGESLLVLCSDELPFFRERLRREPPPAVSLWSPSDRVTVEPLAARLPEDAAREFVDLYLGNMRHRTWRFHLWEPGTDPFLP